MYFKSCLTQFISMNLEIVFYYQFTLITGKLGLWTQQKPYILNNKWGYSTKVWFCYIYWFQLIQFPHKKITKQNHITDGNLRIHITKPLSIYKSIKISHASPKKSNIYLKYFDCWSVVLFFFWKSMILSTRTRYESLMAQSNRIQFSIIFLVHFVKTQ